MSVVSAGARVLRPQTVEGAMELLLAITANDVVTLETICLLGVVPAAAK